LNCNLYQRWLVVAAVYQNDMENEYLDLVLSGAEIYSDFELVFRLYHEILRIESDSEKYLVERKTLIESLPMNLRQLTNSFLMEFIDSIQDKPDQLRLITNYTQNEKEYLINQLVPRNDLDELIKLFPDIQAYLDWDVNPLFSDKITRSIRRYFNEYNISKLRNMKTESLDSVFESSMKTKILSLSGITAWIPSLYRTGSGLYNWMELGLNGFHTSHTLSNKIQKPTTR